MTMKTVLIFLLVFFSRLAYADCIYDGVSHPEGSVIGPYTCTDGKWVKR